MADAQVRLQCSRCSLIFHERDAKTKRVCDGPEEAWGIREVTYRTENRCPDCYSPQLNEVWLCVDCNESTQEEGFDRCYGCQEQHEVRTAEHEADSQHERLLDVVVDIARTVG